MNWLDVVLALILLASVVTSFRKGLSREVISLVSVCLALLSGVWLYGAVGGYLLPYLSSRAMANFAGFAIVFCGVMVLGALLSSIIGKFLKITGLSIFDHALGAGFGIIRGVLVSIALVMGIMAFSQGEEPPGSVVHSRVAPYVVDAARVLVALAPHELKDGFRKSYSRVKTVWGHAARRPIRDLPNGEKAAHEREI